MQESHTDIRLWIWNHQSKCSQEDQKNNVGEQIGKVPVQSKLVPLVVQQWTNNRMA